MTSVCSCDLSEKVKALWNKVQTMVRGIRVNGVLQPVDGQGIVDLDVPDGEEIDRRLNIAEVNIGALSEACQTLEEGLDALSEEVELKASIEYVDEKIGDIESALEAIR